ncbi:hypothetical protein BV011_01511B, partial [Haemophilus influenzae]
RKINCR